MKETMNDERGTMNYKAKAKGKTSCSLFSRRRVSLHHSSFRIHRLIVGRGTELIESLT